MGPTARSQVRSPSRTPSSVSGTRPKGSPSRTGPRTRGTARCPASRRLAPQVAGLDLADGREEGDRQVAVGRHHERGGPVGLQQRLRDLEPGAPAVRGAGHGRRRRAACPLHPHGRPPVRLGDRGGRSFGGRRQRAGGADLLHSRGRHEDHAAPANGGAAKPPAHGTTITQDPRDAPEPSGVCHQSVGEILGVTAVRRHGQRAAVTAPSSTGKVRRTRSTAGPSSTKTTTVPGPTAAPSSHPTRAPPNWTRL